MDTQKYKMRVVRGAFLEPNKLNELGAKSIERFEPNDNWQSIDEVVVDLEQVKELQKNMTRHYDDTLVPWYMDGYDIENKNSKIVAFGADDGEKGKVFQFTRDDKKAIDKVVEYGMSKGIPKEQMDFMDIDF